MNWRRSFDHLVGAAEQRKRHRQTESIRGLEIDDQLDFRGLHDRQLGGLLALENPACVDTGQAVVIRKIASVAQA